MKYSVMVKSGDSVRAGQPIGKVGSSGYSAYPHLHFEVRDGNGNIIDPFSGNCSTRKTSYWVSQPPYDNSTFAIDNGFVPYIPNLDTLQEGYLVSDTFNVNKDTTVCFWALMHRLRKGDIIKAKWYMPDNSLKFDYSYEWKLNWWHDYTWTYIKMPKIKGRWTIMLYVNDKFAVARYFYVVKHHV